MEDSSIQDATTILTDQNESQVVTTNNNHKKRTSKTKKSAKSSSSTSKRSSNRQKTKQNNSAVTNGDTKQPSTSSNVVSSKKKKTTTTTSPPHDHQNNHHDEDEDENNKKHGTRQPKKIAADQASLPPPPQLTSLQVRDLRKIIKDAFGYTLKDMDVKYVEDLYHQLPILIDAWDRIGFNEVTKNERLEKFYNKLTEELDGMVEGEEDLEEQILENINCHLATIKSLCFDLQIKNVEDPKNRPPNFKPRTIMDEDAHLRKEVKRLEAEKTIRVNNFKKLAVIESSLCDKLKMAKTQMIKNIPSEADIAKLASRIEDMERERVQRLSKMAEYKEQCINYHNDLDLSQSDSFVEQILFEEPATMSLGENDLQRASNFLDDLKCKHNAAQEEIRTLRVKIRELWEKLKIDNLNLKEVVINNSSNNASKSMIFNFFLRNSFLHK